MRASGPCHGHGSDSDGKYSSPSPLDGLGSPGIEGSNLQLGLAHELDLLAGAFVGLYYGLVNVGGDVILDVIWGSVVAGPCRGYAESCEGILSDPGGLRPFQAETVPACHRFHDCLSWRHL